MFHHVRRVGEHGPPVPRRPRRRTRLVHRVTVTEQSLVHRQDDRRAGLGPWDLAKSRHGRTVYEGLLSARWRRCLDPVATDGVQWPERLGEAPMGATANTNTEFELRGIN